MKHRILLSLITVVLSCLASYAKNIFPDSETASNEVELGVEGISRLCPTGMWDHWTFRDIVYDMDSNTVVFVIQLADWNRRRNDKEITVISIRDVPTTVDVDMMSQLNIPDLFIECEKMIEQQWIATGRREAIIKNV